MSAHLCGELSNWPTQERMVALLADAGLGVVEERYSLRIKDFSHFVFQEYHGDLGVPTIDADADSVDELLCNSQRVSQALAMAGVRHRFEIYEDDQESMSAYLHYDWPRDVDLGC